MCLEILSINVKLSHSTRNKYFQEGKLKAGDKMKIYRKDDYDPIVVNLKQFIDLREVQFLDYY